MFSAMLVEWRRCWGGRPQYRSRRPTGNCHHDVIYIVSYTVSESEKSKKKIKEKLSTRQVEHKKHDAMITHNTLPSSTKTEVHKSAKTRNDLISAKFPLFSER